MPVGADLVLIGDSASSPIGEPKQTTINELLTAGIGGGGGFIWNDVTTGSATAAAGNAYAADSASLTTISLPASPAFGNTYRVLNINTGGWTIVYSSGQSIIYGTATCTTTSGSLSSSAAGDEVTITAISATVFYAYSTQGNLTVV